MAYFHISFTSVLRTPGLIILLAILAICTDLKGQNLGGGLVVGFNGSQIDGDNFGGYDRFGACLGGFVTFKLSEKFVVQPEIVWDQLGSAAPKAGFSNRLNYVTVPVFVNFKLPITIGRRVHDLQFQAGPAVGILLNAKDAITREDFTESIRGADLKAIGGATFDVGRRLAVALRFGYSLQSIIKGGPTLTGFSPGASVFNNYIQFGFLYYIASY